MTQAQVMQTAAVQNLKVDICKTAIEYTTPDGNRYPIKYRAFLKEAKDFGRRPLFVSSTTVYRFVHADINAFENFIPVVFLPPRIHTPQESHKKACHFSLSVYNSEQHIREKFSELQHDYPHIISRIGNHYTSFPIEESAGCHTRSSSNGHFELHESEDFSPKLKSATPEPI